MKGTTRSVIVASAGYLCLIVVLAVVASLFEGCQLRDCTTVYRYDGTVYYRLDLCNGQPPRAVCESKDRLPNQECK